MVKQLRFIKAITLFGVLSALTILFAQNYYTPADQSNLPAASSMFELLGVVSSFTITLLSLIMVCAHLFSGGRLNKQILIAISTLSIFVAISLDYGGWKYGPFTVASIFITYIYLFDILYRTAPHEMAVTLVQHFFSIAAILPIFLYALFPSLREMLESPEGNFKGFESSRTTYGCIACVAFVLHLIERRRGWIIYIFLILIGVFMAQSRAPVILIFTIIFYTIMYDDRLRNKKTVFVFLGASLSVFIMIFIAFGTRGEEALQESHRFLLINHHINYVTNHLLLGSGGDIVLDTIIMSDGEEIFKPSSSHNFLIETLVGFGLPVTILWVTVLWMLWKKISRTGRVFILLLIGYGLLHNGFGLGVINSFNFIILLLAISVKNYFVDANFGRIASTKL